MTTSRPSHRRAAWSGWFTEPLAGVIPGPLMPGALAFIKALHTFLFFSITLALAVTLWDGIRGTTRRRTLVCGAIVAAETATYVSNNQVCPLTPLAEELGAGSGSVVDLYLPAVVARRIPLVAGTAAMVAVAANLRVLIGRRRRA